LAAFVAPGPFSRALTALSTWYLQIFDGWTLFLASACLLFCAGLALTPLGRLKLGGENRQPEFGLLTWGGMMFAAGMGAGLVFWGAAEPLIHTVNPPPGEGLQPLSPEARRYGLALTQFHWGLHAWAIYGVAAVAIGLASAAHGSLMPSAPFGAMPRVARRAIDLIALVAVLFGLVASLGQGVFQMGAGLSVIGVGAEDPSAPRQLLLLFGIAVAYLASAILGLRRGIAVLSNVNIALALALAVFLLIAAPTSPVGRSLTESAVHYIGRFAEFSLTLREEGPARDWTRDWSLTYLLWWVAWTPFVGVFLARISRGRSVRSFITMAVLVPSLVTLLWFSVLGGAAIGLAEAHVDLGVDNFDTAPQATYALLGQLPFALPSSVLTLILVAIFLVTSADSGAYVLAMLSSTDESPGVGARLFWGVVLTILTGAAILSEGGQNVTRAMAVAGALPMTFLLAGQAGATLWRYRPDRWRDLGGS
jgi:choline-glycine betaine transporter